MWVRGAAIRHVPAWAVIPGWVLEDIERELSENTQAARTEVDDAFSRFEKTQPYLAEKVAGTLAKPLDETALALGYFLTIAVWLAFERAFGARLGAVGEEDLQVTEAQIALEEELRAEHAEQPVDLDDVVAAEQPAVLAFVNEHVEAALDVAASEAQKAGQDRDVDVDDVDSVYRTVVVLTLALSHAVAPDGPRPDAMLD